jgi:hypothetical protein
MGYTKAERQRVLAGFDRGIDDINRDEHGNLVCGLCGRQVERLASAESTRCLDCAGVELQDR